MAQLEIVIDSLNPTTLARFWAQVLHGYRVRPYDDAEMARLAALGLTPETDTSVAVDGNGDRHTGHTVMLDPEGNEFCVLDRAANP